MIADLQKLPHQFKLVLEHAKESIPQEFVHFRYAKSLFLLGKGSAEAVAKEGALKLKEVAYIHAEGYSSSALKHGAFALICDHLPILLLDIDDEHRAKNQSAFEEVSARNAFVLRITDVPMENAFVIPKNTTFAPILANVYVQLLSYFLALDFGYDPDFPRNLAKVVTVD
jgi:glutamine---fructose-6-phosphate transaminase (isomerizing)